MRRDPGDQKMQDIAKLVQEGAKAFLTAEYKWLAVFVAIVAVVIGISPVANAIATIATMPSVRDWRRS